MTREEILAAAKQCVCGGRETDYGTPEDSFGLIGQYWTVYTGHERGRCYAAGASGSRPRGADHC